MKAPRIAQYKALNETRKCQMDSLQCKKVNSPPELQLKDDGSRSSGGPVPDEFLDRMTEGHGINARETEVVTDSELAEQSRAKAVSTGGQIHVAPGQFKKSGDSLSKDTELLLSHEWAHERQKKNGEVTTTGSINGMALNDDQGLEDKADRDGADAVAGKAATSVATGSVSAGAGQAYAEGTVNDSPAMVSKDLSVAKPNEDKKALYAEAGKAEESNKLLAATGGAIRLVETGESATVSTGDQTKTLKKVMPQNMMNGTSGEDMKLYADCGRASSMIMGSLSRHANYTDMEGNDRKTGTHGDPMYMKYEIFDGVFNHLKNDAEYKDDKRIQRYVTRYFKYKQDAFDLKDQLDAATDEKTINRLRKKVDIAWNRALDTYHLLPQKSREKFDADLGINKHANPNVGEGYAISSGGPDFGGMQHNTWNFHWGGVVMKSSDGKDNITLENFSVGNWEAQNDKWSFSMYGPAEEKGQTFHEKMYKTRTLGTKPTTMGVARSFNGSRR